MAIGPRLEMRQGQSLVMTPQLQQAIKLLQLSNLELGEYVEQELEKNPLLEAIAAEPEAERLNASDDMSDSGDFDAGPVAETAQTPSEGGPQMGRASWRER